MAPLVHSQDPTLLAADKALEEKALQEEPRPYLGMSSIGESCWRKIWYRYRFIAKEKFDAITLKRFSDGHRTEDLIIDRLKMVDGLDIVSMSGGNQIRITDINGHYSGHLDGTIIGILQAPKTPHVLEIKCTSEKKFNELKRIIYELGEKKALQKWNEVYYAQGQSYMHYMGYSRHYLVVATPGGRDWVSARTEYNLEYAIKLKTKAEYIINTNKPPEKISQKPEWYECRFCYFSSVCHQDDMPDRNCRTCLHSTPIENGQWHCARFGKTLTKQEQMQGCPVHKFIPALVPGEMIEVTDSMVKYRLYNGTEWMDGE